MVVYSKRIYNRLLMIEKPQGKPETKRRKSNAGRPTVVTSEALQKLQEAFLMDCTDEEACLNANIGTSTLYNYQKENPEFLEKKGIWKHTPFLLARKTILKGLSEDHEFALKYMKNKKNKEFSEKNETEHSGDVGVTMTITNFSTHDED